MSDCMNLREMFGDRLRITFDQAYEPRKVPKDKLDPWMMQIPCKFGTIYPYGSDILAIEVDHHFHVAPVLNALKGVTLYQDGDGEKTFLFPLELFDKVTAIVQPRQRRHGNPENGARLSAYWFKKKEPKTPPEAGGDPKP